MFGLYSFKAKVLSNVYVANTSFQYSHKDTCSCPQLAS
jgi:hypothetical protein